MTNRAKLTQELVKTLLHYDPETGIFRWRASSSRHIAGDIAGTPIKAGYLKISINGVSYYAHRLAWLYVHGSWPIGNIDHEDETGSNNRLSNLRPATKSENAQNIRLAHRDNEAGLLGVLRVPYNNKWAAQICINGKRKHLGCFLTPQEAHAAYLNAKSKDHPFAFKVSPHTTSDNSALTYETR